MSPVLMVALGSNSRISAPSAENGWCGVPRGTTYTSPGPSSTSPASIRIVSRPDSTRKNSSVSGWLCRVNSPEARATRTS